MVVSEKVRKAVVNGRDFLDKYFGHPSWRRACEGFEIWSPYSCIFGKLFGSIIKGAELFNMDIVQLENLGFERFNDVSYEELQQAWEDEFANPPLGTDDEPDTELCQALFQKSS